MKVLKVKRRYLLHLGYRYCNDEQTKEIITCVQQTEHLRVAKIQSEVMTVEECNRRLLENQSETYVGIVRSGQVITALGDLVVIGDVNPNGRVVAGGNIFVLRTLKRNCSCWFNWKQRCSYSSFLVRSNAFNH